MQTTEAQQLLIEIFERAEKEQITEFQLITSWNAFISCWRIHKATKLVISMLKDSADKLFKQYCKDTVIGSTVVDDILAYREILNVIAFYRKDLAVLRSMLDEYDTYLGQGHFWYSFLGGERDTWNIH